MKVGGIGVPKKEWVWMPVSVYYIEHPKGKILVDTGWHRRISPEGKLDARAQIKELGYMVYKLNQGFLPSGKAVDEQLAAMGVNTADIDYVVLTHLDCDHVCGVEQVGDAKKILESEEEYASDKKFSLISIVRFQKRWWKNVNLTFFPWNGGEGPFKKSFDLLGDGSVQLINIPGHTAGLCAVRITGEDGRFVLLVSDGAYGRKSRQDMILPGIAENRNEQEISLEWIRQQSMDPKCVEILANHDIAVKPHEIMI